MVTILTERAQWPGTNLLFHIATEDLVNIRAGSLECEHRRDFPECHATYEISQTQRMRIRGGKEKVKLYNPSPNYNHAPPTNLQLCSHASPALPMIVYSTDLFTISSFVAETRVTICAEIPVVTIHKSPCYLPILSVVKAIEHYPSPQIQFFYDFVGTHDCKIVLG